jgi:lactoylglutathione lyase
MRNHMTIILVVALVAGAMSYDTNAEQEKKSIKEKPMKLGVFSVSLAVKDIHKSKAFYEKLGFRKIAGEIKQNWIVLQNDQTTIGLFQGMFPKNLMTFNPGWNHKKETLKEFVDVRKIQEHLEKNGIKITTRADPATTGPASVVIADPDGNTILFDQHVPAPAKSK